MGECTDFGNTWEDIVEHWYLGAPPFHSREIVLEALDVLERLWPEHLDEILNRGAKGWPIMAALVDDGLALSRCKHLDGFPEVLNRLKIKEPGAYGELLVASEIGALGYPVSFGPELQGRRLDLRVQVDGDEVFIEVVMPLTADAVRQGYEQARVFSEKVGVENPAASIEIVALADLPEVSDRILQTIKQVTRPFGGGVIEVPGVAHLRLDEFRPELEAFEVEATRNMPMLGVAHIRSKEGVVTRVNVRFPMSDDRAQRMVAQELHHFSPDNVNVLILDVSRVPRGVERWSGGIARLFQPGRNRRISAVALVERVASEGRMVATWAVLPNPHAYRVCPQVLVDRIQSLT